MGELTPGDPGRIAVLSHVHPSLSRGGAEIAAHTLFTGLREIGVDAILERGEVKLPKPVDLTLRPRFVSELGEWRPAPELERLSEPLGRGRRI